MVRKRSARSRKPKGHEMVREIKRVAKGYPQHAGLYCLVAAPKKPAAEVRCVLWGRDPVTGERICLKWEDV